MRSNSQSGFTLIELVVVIVILGILAVTAAPRLMGISSDAIAASMQSFKGTLKSANNIVYSKAIIKGVDDFEEGMIASPSGDRIITRFGYLSYSSSEPELSGEQIGLALDISLCHYKSSSCNDSEWSYDVSGNDIVFYHRNIADKISSGGVSSEDVQCSLTYMLPESEGLQPKYVIEDEGC